MTWIGTFEALLVVSAVGTKGSSSRLADPILHLPSAGQSGGFDPLICPWELIKVDAVARDDECVAINIILVYDWKSNELIRMTEQPAIPLMHTHGKTTVLMVIGCNNVRVGNNGWQ